MQTKNMTNRLQSIIDRTHADRPSLWTRQMQTDGVLQNQSENCGLEGKGRQRPYRQTDYSR